MKKIKISANSLSPLNPTLNKPSTIVRAAITAEIKPTRGKELVEHNPITLIPDPHNPRPGDIIDDAWLNDYLLINSERSLCRFNESTNEYIIPSIELFGAHFPKEVKEHYEFLKTLAFSIRNDGLIEPIEIFLADKTNDPEYFVGSNLDYGYVVLEGHQRRLAAIIAGVKTVTCIQITDETMLAKLKVKHRKLRRQLSENNIRKGLSTGQNYKIVKELLSSDNAYAISVKELSSIIGLNEDISGALKRLVVNAHDYPSRMLEYIANSRVSFKWIRTWISRSADEINQELNRLDSPKSFQKITETSIKSVKTRGRNGGAVKRSAIFKITKEEDSLALQNILLSRFPQLKVELSEIFVFKNLELVLESLLDLAKRETRPGSDLG